MITTETKLAFARFQLTNFFPYFSHYLTMFRYLENNSIDTMSITKDGVIYYNKEFVDKLHNFEVVTVLLHELLHFLYKHHERRVLKNADPEIWNLSGDIVVNLEIRDICKTNTSLKLIKNCITNKSFTPELPENLTVEQYYDLLISQNTKLKCETCGSLKSLKGEDKDSDGKNTNQCCSKKIGKGCCGSGAGNKEIDGEEKDNLGVHDEEDWKLAEQMIAKNVQEAEQKSRGLIPAGLLIWAKNVYQPPKISWKNKFRSVFSKSMNQILGSVDYTFRKPSRNQVIFGYKPGSIILPSLYAPEITVAIGLDTSGSMQGESLEIALREINGIIKSQTNKISFYACDAEVQAVKKVSSLNDVLKNLKGGGGTYLTPIFDEMKKRKDIADIIVIITDGYSDIPQNQPKNTKIIYLITGRGYDPGYKGQVIFMEN